MRKKWHHFLVLSLSMLVGTSCTQVTNPELTDLVDPYIGSGGHGHVFVGANVPFGAIQAGPQNIHKGWDWCSGYHYSDSIIIGFSHTHLSGTGCTDLGDVLIMPFTGNMRTQRGEQTNIENSCSSYYSHKNETVSPGYYSLLMDNGIKDEMTTTTRTAIHRITYPQDTENRLLINLQEGNGDRSVDTYMKQIDEYTVEGHRISEGWTKHHIYFTLKSDQPMQTIALFDGDSPKEGQTIQSAGVKGVITFGKAEKVMLKVTISSVSCTNAMANMTAELPDWDFEKTHQRAIAQWNDQLKAIDIESADPTIKKIFYTAMYHTTIAPVTYCDANGEFRGHNDSIIKADWTNYSIFSLWDTYRALHPLFTLTRHDVLPDMINSMLSIHEQQSKLPVWPLIGGESGRRKQK